LSKVNIPVLGQPLSKVRLCRRSIYLSKVRLMSYFMYTSRSWLLVLLLILSKVLVSLYTPSAVSTEKMCVTAPKFMASFRGEKLGIGNNHFFVQLYNLREIDHWRQGVCVGMILEVSEITICEYIVEEGKKISQICSTV
jgi:hypothetical protein